MSKDNSSESIVNDKEKNTQVKAVKQIFEKGKCNDGSEAPASERRRVRMSANIEFLQKKLAPNEENEQAKSSKSNDSKQPKLQNARSKCTWTPGVMPGVARKRSRSRFPATTKKTVATGQSVKKERPYRQWLGVSPFVTYDSKYIISSKPSRHSLEMNAVDSSHTCRKTKGNANRPNKAVCDHCNSPERLVDTMPSTQRTCICAHQVQAEQIPATKTGKDVEEAATSQSQVNKYKSSDEDGIVSTSLSDEDCKSVSYTISELTRLLEKDSRKNSQQSMNGEVFNQHSSMDLDSPNGTSLTTHNENVIGSPQDHGIINTSKAETEVSQTKNSEAELINTKSYIIASSLENVSTKDLENDTDLETSSEKDSQLHDLQESRNETQQENTSSSDAVTLAETPSFKRGDSSTVVDIVQSDDQSDIIFSNVRSSNEEKKASLLETVEAGKEKKHSVENTSNMDTSEILWSDLSWQEFTDDESLESESCFKFNVAARVKESNHPGYKRMTWRSRMEKSSSLKSNIYPRFEDGYCWADFNTKKRELNRVIKKKSVQAAPCVEQNKITAQHSTTESSHIKGLSTPEIKRKPSSLSPGVSGASSSKRPMLRTAARASQRSRQESPCTNNADTTPYPKWTPVCTPKDGRLEYMNKVSGKKLDTVAFSICNDIERGQPGYLMTMSAIQGPPNEFHKADKSETVEKSENHTDHVHLPKHNKYKSVGARQLLQKINWTSKHDQKQGYKLVQAVMDFRGTLPGQLSFRKGQIIRQRCETETQASDLCYGSYSVGRLKKKRKGLFPAYCVAEYTSPS
ncbi:hypothetical protein BgiMline_012692 [Biomphalaria glabrata]|uniref:Uncharacterized protein LOC106060807 n=1 Tax=Biomphalaria glabrata TaxID=6526 RepID=A0A9U8E5Q8_BIOGL|nr:uncharacterized protein LOC106060807 [Biomphalaria glabrata]KAI8749599.1 hypothetical protein BgiMline_016549 [Biomphalaria glabrata]